MADPLDAQAQVIQRLQGLKNAKGPVGIMARGNTIYNGTSNAAQSGPGGPDMGRPSINTTGMQNSLQDMQSKMNQQQVIQQQANQQQSQDQGLMQRQIPPAAAQAVLDRTGMPQQAQQPADFRRSMPQGAQVVAPGSPMAASPQLEKAASTINRNASKVASMAMRAAAQRKLSRSK